MVYNGKEEPSIESFMTTDEKGVRLRDAVYQTEENIKKLPLTLPFLDQWGLLDEM